MSEAVPYAVDSLRVSDLVPLQRSLGTDAVLLRVDVEGGFTPLERMPALFFDRPIRRILTHQVSDRFNEACAFAVSNRQAVAFRSESSPTDAVMINPILEDQGPSCRFLLCWARQPSVVEHASSPAAWDQLELEHVHTRFRLRTDETSVVVEAAPWWAPARGELLELWPHHARISAMGLGHAVMQALIIDAVEAAAESGGGPAVRLDVPAADMLAGLVPVVHGALRSSEADPVRITLGVDVELAVDADLLPIIVHLRTMGVGIDIVGLDALTSALYAISDTSAITPPPRPSPSTSLEFGPWADSFAAALTQTL